MSSITYTKKNFTGHKEYKAIDLNKELKHLNYRFYEATKFLGNKNVQGTDLYEYQVDFAYKLNKLKYAPYNALHKIISNIHQYINDIGTSIN